MSLRTGEEGVRVGLDGESGVLSEEFRKKEGCWPADRKIDGQNEVSFEDSTRMGQWCGKRE